MGNSASCNSQQDEEIVGKGNLQSNMLRMLPDDDIFDKYNVTEVLGSGSMGYVAKGVVKEDKIGGSAVQKKSLIKKLASGGSGVEIKERRKQTVEFAIKSIHVERVSDLFLNELKNEIDILRSLDHPNIVKAYEVSEGKRQIYIVLELCSGGSLYSRGPYSEKESAQISECLLSAVKYLHDHGVVHRDLKYENIMWEHDGPDAEIKVIDFGLSKKFGSGEKDEMTASVGTFYSMSPQVLQGVYTSQADLWSCGVIIYMLLTSRRPFYHKQRRIMIDKIMRARCVMDGDRWKGISSEAKDLVSQLLKLDPKERLTATQALENEWIVCNGSKRGGSDIGPDVSSQTKKDDVNEKVKANLRAYQNELELKKIALNIIAYRSSAKEISELRKCFNHYDKSGDGIIEIHEFKAAMGDANFTEDEIQEMFNSVDVNQNGLVQYTEFLAASLEANSMIEEERIAEAFDRLDNDNTGFISKNNLINFFGSDKSADEINRLLSEVDENKDGQISYKEFKAIFRKQRRAVKRDMLEETEFPEETEDAGDDLLGLDANIPGGKFDI